MPRFRDHDWDLRADGNGFVWRVFGQFGEPTIIRQGWAGSRIRAEELAQAAIVNIEAPAEAKPARKPLFGWGRPLGERA
jgi:hypothetical protein